MTPLLSRESRKRKRRIYSKAEKALRDLTAAFHEMVEFVEDHESLYRKSEIDMRMIDQIKHDAGTVDIRPWLRSEFNAEYVVHLFNTLSEDK